MCGIAGVWSPSDGRIESLRDDAFAMVNAISHRGPDDGGAWVDAEAGIALGHRRLSIIDVSPAGHQPMASACGRFIIVFNGEIYNFEELRAQLQTAGVAPAWRGHSDTEVFLAAVSAWGIRRTVEKCVGMFALALWDKLERTLYLARDRIGEKPLYYGWCGKVFLFGSELKALRAHAAWRGTVDRGSLALLLKHNYIPAPYSIFENIHKLIPGTLLRIECAKDAAQAKAAMGRVGPEPYWSARSIAEEGLRTAFEGSESEAVGALERLLSDAVRAQMVSDVPLGAFLSGGIDSSTVVALMQAQSNKPIKTFTIGFHERQYNEAEHAAEVAKHLGTDHTELYVTPREALDVIPLLPALYDEPFSDSSQIPTYLVARLARRSVTVSLSGDAGDELFAGYNRYFWGLRIWRRLGWVPLGIRRAASKALTCLSPDAWDSLFDAIRPALPGVLRYKRPGESVHKLARILGSPTPDGMYRTLISHTDVPERYLNGAVTVPDVIEDLRSSSVFPLVPSMMYLDTVSYLPDDILVKVDRASMGVSLESRLPFLDHRVVEFAWRLPIGMKIREGQGKWILRQVLYRYVPKAIVERPKMGFGVPIDSWLRGPLRPWAEEMLSEVRLRREGFFAIKEVRRKWMEHLSGRKNWQYFLWNILMFQAWLADAASSSVSHTNFAREIRAH